MEQYKSKIATMESEISSQKRENDRLQYELDATKLKLQKAEEERDREGEELALYEERVKELEEETPITHTRRRKKTAETEEGEEGDTSTTAFDASFDRHVDEETGIIEGIGGELNDAIEGRTMTSLKLELRKLQREIKILRSAQDEEDEDGNGPSKKSRYLVLENLLEDANRMKRKYEDDYLKQYRETLVLTNQLEEIRSGKSVNGDGAEASIALRQRLNETTEELEKLKAEHIELTVSYEQGNQELILAKSDLNLVGKDQLEMLSSLRDSVSTEKIALQDELDRLKKEQGSLRDQLSMKTEQIQSLLLEKINLQSDSIDQRERMLLRERQLSGGQVKSPKTDELSEEARTKLGVTEQLYKEKDDECRMLKAKLDKAKLFIMSQDKLYKESVDGRGSHLLPVDVSSLVTCFLLVHNIKACLTSDVIPLFLFVDIHRITISMKPCKLIKLN
jgi:protein HOOK3